MRRASVMMGLVASYGLPFPLRLVRDTANSSTLECPDQPQALMIKQFRELYPRVLRLLDTETYANYRTLRVAPLL